ncbi:MAG: PKD domain-containing protein [Candidatus Thermoplasmatota archaeon]|nr:PKD domain-containing protein [Candidatus Thermoplasmatota archaeon]
MKKLFKKAFAKLTIIGFISIFIVFSFPISAGNNNVLSITPGTQNVSSDDVFSVNVYCTPVQPIKGFELVISFNPSLVKAINVTEGDFFKGFKTYFNKGIIDNTKGFIKNIYNFIIGPGNTSTPGVLCTINFSAKVYTGSSFINFYQVGQKTGVTNEKNYLPVTVVNGKVNVEGLYELPSNPVNPPSGNQETNNAPDPPLKPVGPTVVEPGVEYLYSTYCFDLDNDLVKIKIDWGDGSLSNWSDFVAPNTMVNFTHCWDNVSVYPVKAIAQDEHEVNSTWSDVLYVSVSEFNGETKPILFFKITGNSTVNETIFFDASECFDPDGLIVYYNWFFGDGDNATGVNVTHFYKNPGEYNVELVAVDAFNNTYKKLVKLVISNETIDEQIQGKNDDVFFTNFLTYIFMGGLIFCLALVLIMFRKNIQYILLNNNIFLKIIIRFNVKRLEFIENKIKKTLIKTSADYRDDKKPFFITGILQRINFFDIGKQKSVYDYESNVYLKDFDTFKDDKLEKLLQQSFEPGYKYVERSNKLYEIFDIDEIVDLVLTIKSKEGYFLEH